MSGIEKVSVYFFIFECSNRFFIVTLKLGSQSWLLVHGKFREGVRNAETKEKETMKRKKGNEGPIYIFLRINKF